MKVKPGQIVYHKLTGQPLLVIDDIDKLYTINHVENPETIVCRYQLLTGIYQSDSFYLYELLEKRPLYGQINISGSCRH